METTQAPETNATAVEVIDGIEVRTIETNDEPKEDAMTAKETKAPKKSASKKAGAKAKAAPAGKAKANPAKKAAAPKTPAKKNAKVNVATLTMGELPEYYRAELERVGKTPKTALSYMADLKAAARFFGPATKVSALTPAKVKAYFESDAVTKNRKGGPRNPITVAKQARTLRLSLVHLASIGAIKTAPIPDAK